MFNNSPATILHVDKMIILIINKDNIYEFRRSSQDNSIIKWQSTTRETNLRIKDGEDIFSTHFLATAERSNPVRHYLTLSEPNLTYDNHENTHENM